MEARWSCSDAAYPLPQLDRRPPRLVGNGARAVVAGLVLHQELHLKRLLHDYVHDLHAQRRGSGQARRQERAWVSGTHLLLHCDLHAQAARVRLRPDEPGIGQLHLLLQLRQAPQAEGQQLRRLGRCIDPRRPHVPGTASDMRLAGHPLRAARALAYRPQPRHSCKMSCRGMPSVMSTSSRRHVGHMLAALGRMSWPHLQH